MESITHVVHLSASSGKHSTSNNSYQLGGILNCGFNCSRIHQLEPYFYIPLSTVNAILSAWSLGFFARNAGSVHPVLRQLLMALSAFEVLFHGSVLTFYARVLHHTLSGPEQSRMNPASGLGSAAQLCLLRFSLTMRNWTMNFISWSRLEAVFRPLAVRSHSLFRLSNVIAMETVAGLLGLALSVAMVVAHDANGLTGSSLHAVEVTFYTYQGMLPIVSIFAATCITVCVLRRAGFERRAAVAAPATGTIRQCRRERQAIRIIVALSISCLILEGPTDLCGFVRSKTPLTELIVNTLVELDSLFNFFLLACTTGMCRQDRSSSNIRNAYLDRDRWRGTTAQRTTRPIVPINNQQRDSVCSFDDCNNCRAVVQDADVETTLLESSPHLLAAVLAAAKETAV